MIVIPMAGLSSRFFKAGYEKPKYMLEAHGKTLFDHSVSSFEKYFGTEHFVFVVRNVFDTPDFVARHAEALGIGSYQVVVLEEETRGQAETVYLALKQVHEDEQPLTIFNIDTFRPGFTFPTESGVGSGYLEVFQGPGEHWSFAEPAASDSTLVKRTAEKIRISDLCSTGLYYFRHAKYFMEAFEQYCLTPKSEWPKGELYIAPLYNLLIERAHPVHYHLIARDEVIFCGTPEEYTDLLGQEQKD